MKITRRDALRGAAAVAVAGAVALSTTDDTLALTPQEQYNAYIQQAARLVNNAADLRGRFTPKDIS